MDGTDGHRVEKVVLYARSATDERGDGRAVVRQLETLRTYAIVEGYEVLDEVADPGRSGSRLERPGMDRVRRLVATGEVDVVLATEPNRFYRGPFGLFILKEEFGAYGTELRDLNVWVRNVDE